MRVRGRRLMFVAMLGMLLMSCLLPGMIPLKSEPDGPMPFMEDDPEKMLETLQELWSA